LTLDGTVVVWGGAGGDSGPMQVPTGLSDVVAIAAGEYSSLALKADGTVVAWGYTAWSLG
jgi:alpha-tubulin suppressor-like RCC1 family protein